MDGYSNVKISLERYVDMDTYERLALAQNIGTIMMMIGFTLFIDEIGFWMTGIPVGWLLGDWSVLHIDPFHHWMWGVLSFYGGLGIFITSIYLQKKALMV